MKNRNPKPEPAETEGVSPEELQNSLMRKWNRRAVASRLRAQLGKPASQTESAA